MSKQPKTGFKNTYISRHQVENNNLFPEKNKVTK